MSKTIVMVAVVSSMIATIGHDAETSTLRVEFKNGDTWDYANVNTDMHTNIMEASSIGAFFDANVKKHGDQYPGAKVNIIVPAALSPSEPGVATGATYGAEAEKFE